MLTGLIGYRGSGKTTVGRALAERSGRLFMDTDVLIVQRAGATIREIFEQQGEAAFRNLETAVVQEVSKSVNGVIAFGGGALDREENVRAISKISRVLIYLRCDPAILLARIHNDPLTASTRPDLTRLGGGMAEITTMLARREPIWRSVMSAEIDVTKLSAGEVVDAIIQIEAEIHAPGPEQT